MKELVQLEKHWEEFAKKNVKIFVISIEGLDEAKAIQKDFPHLIVVSDEQRKLTDAIAAIHPESGPDGGDTAAPTTLLIDGSGTVRWTYRPERVFDRLAPGQLLAVVDEHLS